MEFLAQIHENTSLDYRFIRAIGVQLNIKSEPGERKKDVIHSVDPASLCLQPARCLLTIKSWITERM